MLRLLLLTAGAAILSSCNQGEASSGERPPLGGEIRKVEATRVRTAPAERREMVRTLSTTTTLESARQIEVFPRVAGVVTEVLVEEGKSVDADDVLARLDNRVANGQFADANLAVTEAEERVDALEVAANEAKERAESARLGFEQADAEYKRNEEAGLISKIDLAKLKLTRDTNERTWKAAVHSHEAAVIDQENQALVIERAQLTASREELAVSFYEVKAPFAGTVAARSVRVGDTVSTSAAVFTLTDTNHLRCIVPRPQRELAFFLGAGSSDERVDITIEPEAYPGRIYQGSIDIVSPTIDETSGSFRLTIGIEQPGQDDPRPRLLPGMLVRMTIVTERHPDALVVPKRALRREGDRHFVYVNRDGTAERIAVEEGFQNDDWVEILTIDDDADLDVGTEVVVVGNRDLEDGKAIDVDRTGEKEIADDSAGSEPAEEESVEGETTEDDPVVEETVEGETVEPETVEEESVETESVDTDSSKD